MVRGGRAGLAGRHRRPEGRTGAAPEIWRSVRARLSINRAGISDLRARRGPDNRGKLRQHFDPEVFGQRARGYLTVRLTPDRRARSRAPADFAWARSRGMVYR